jgi:hypothetical protein
MRRPIVLSLTIQKGFPDSFYYHSKGRGALYEQSKSTSIIKLMAVLAPPHSCQIDTKIEGIWVICKFLQQILKYLY